jgi:hypothetical protein
MNAGAPERSRARAVAIVAVATMFVSLAAPSVIAQSTAPALTAPKAQSKSSQPASARAAPAGRANPCSIYGEGFANVPGTDTCVKVGGYVRSDAGVNLGR